MGIYINRSNFVQNNLSCLKRLTENRFKDIITRMYYKSKVLFRKTVLFTAFHEN